MQSEGIEREMRVVCVFSDAPIGDSTIAVRWRRLARYACGLGPSIAVVTRDIDAVAAHALDVELGAPVVALQTRRQSRLTGLTKAVLQPWRSWPPARTDIATARRRLDHVLRDAFGDEGPGIIWCAGAEAFLAVPKRLQRRTVVDYSDLPSRNRRELARVALHRIGRRIVRDGGVDASVLGLAREVQGGISSSWIERYVAARAAASTVASPTEVRPGAHCVRTGVDDPGIVDPPADDFPVPHFVFPGSFLYPPHQDAAEWFALYVLPPLRKLLPACRVVFAGESPSWMASFGQLHGIEITGPPGDMGEVLDARSVVIAPIRAGSGTIIEVIDAWARGVPVVATSRAVEGLQASDDVDVLVADDPAEFAARCSMAARYPELRAKLAGNGRARYEAEFTWPCIGDDLVAWLGELTGTPLPAPASGREP